jgi:lipoprotein-releasing system permease protein
MLGSMALIISLSVLYGYDRMLRENAVKFTSHIMVRSFNKTVLPDYPKGIEYIKSQFPDVIKIAPVIEREGLIRSKSFVEGIMIRGILPQYDITKISNNLKEGTFSFASDSAYQIIIGKRLARKLNSSIGDSVVLYAIKEYQAGTIPFPEIAKFKIIGIYETGMAKYDDIYTYVPFPTSEKFFSIPQNGTSGYDMILSDISKSELVAGRLQKQLGYPYFAYTVFELHSSIFAWIELQKEPIPLVLGLIGIVAVLNIITILLVTVVEKTLSIGILRALGMSKNDIITIFVFQGTTLGLAGTITGSALGLLFCYLQKTFELVRLNGNVYFLDVLPIKIDPMHYLIVIGIGTVLSFFATLIPSFISARTEPIKAIRFK